MGLGVALRQLVFLCAYRLCLPPLPLPFLLLFSIYSSWVIAGERKPSSSVHLFWHCLAKAEERFALWNQHLSRERLTLPPCSQPQTPFQSYILELLSDEAQNSPEKTEDIQLQLHKHTLTGKGHRVSLYGLHIPSTSKNLLNKIPRSTKINSQSTFVVIHAKYSMWPKTKIKAICLMRIFPTETQLVMSADFVGSVLFTI